MSWFQEIAGKAENFLNAMDKGAATALSNVKSTGTNSANSSRRLSMKSDTNDSTNGTFTYDTEFIDSPEIISLKTSPSSSSLHSGNGGNGSGSSGLHFKGHRKTLSNDSVTSRASSSKVVDDDRLLDYLNNKDNDLPEEEWNTLNTIEDNTSDHSSNPSHVSTGLEDTSKLNLVKIQTLTKELSALNKRYNELTYNNKQLQRKAISVHNQNVTNEKLIKELKAKEVDLMATLKTKDSQLESFRIQFEQLSAESKQKTVQLMEMESTTVQLHQQLTANQNDNERVQLLEHELANVRQTFNNEREELKHLQELKNQQIAHLVDNQRSLVDELESVQRTLAKTRQCNSELELQRNSIQKKFENLETEYQEFKHKANKTLADKDELIHVLNSNKANETGDTITDGDGNRGEEEHIRLLQQQYDSLVNEMADLRMKYDKTKVLLETAQNETIPRQEYEIKNLKEKLEEEERIISTLKQDVQQLSEEAKSYQDDFNQIRSNLATRINERDEEIEKLRKQLVIRQQSRHVSSPSDGDNSLNIDDANSNIESHSNEWKQRLKSLTESLIQKQSTNEQLSSANHSLKLQLERSEQRLRELTSNTNNFMNDVAIGIYHSPTFTNLIKHRMTGNGNGNGIGDTVSLMEDNPNDGQVTRKVKRAYGAIDAFSIRLGNFLRVYPSARAMFLIYIVILHLWVFFVLLYYEPEIHNNHPSNKSGNFPTDAGR